MTITAETPFFMDPSPLSRLLGNDGVVSEKGGREAVFLCGGTKAVPVPVPKNSVLADVIQKTSEENGRGAWPGDLSVDLVNDDMSDYDDDFERRHHHHHHPRRVFSLLAPAPAKPAAASKPLYDPFAVGMYYPFAWMWMYWNPWMWMYCPHPMWW